MSIKATLIVLFSLVVGSSPARGEDDWCVTVYTALIVESPMVEVPLHLSEADPGFRLVAVALNRRLATLGNTLDIEAEAQVAHYVRGNDHTELNGLGVLRWLPFPWDRYLETSFAFGPGLSFASEIPYYESIHFKDTNKILAYLLWEFDFAHPRLPNWRLVARLHHRSGIYGTFNGVSAGSNAIGFGIKHAF